MRQISLRQPADRNDKEIMNLESAKNFQTKSYPIVSKVTLTDDTVLFRLRGRLDFKPGQFVEILLPHFGNVTLAPCSGLTNKKEFELCVRAQGSTSDALVQLLPGDNIALRGPYGHGWPTLTMSRGPLDKIHRDGLIIISGGMGIVPLRPTLLNLENKIHSSKLSLFAGFRRSVDVLFEPDLKRWKRKFKVHVAAESAEPGFWGNRGLITELLETGSVNKNSYVLMCGPEKMYQYCIKILLKKGIDSKRIFLSLERRMECGIGLCQHCSCGKHLVCQDGPVFRFDEIKKELNIENSIDTNK